MGPCLAFCKSSRPCAGENILHIAALNLCKTQEPRGIPHLAAESARIDEQALAQSEPLTAVRRKIALAAVLLYQRLRELRA